MKIKYTITVFFILGACLCAGYGAGSFFAKLTEMKQSGKTETAGYFGESNIRINDGRMTPEALLAFGRLSDPQLSPDGTKILYGVSYNSIEKNTSCRNIFVCDTDGGHKVQLTFYAKSISNARWSRDGKSIYFLQEGQMWNAPYQDGKLGRKTKLSDVPAGISEFSISPNESNVMYISTIKGNVKTPSDCDPALDKAKAYVAEDLMYRHWDHWVTDIPRTFVAALNGNTISPDNSFDILGTDTLFELPTEPFGGMEQLCWHPDSRHIAYSCRKKTGIEYAFSTNTEIYLYDILTGATEVIPMGGGYDTDPVWSPDGKHLAWISMPRDGYEADRQRLMLADIEFPESNGEGQCADICISGIRELAAGLDRDAAGIFWAPGSDYIIFPANTEGLQALFSVNTDGRNPEVKRLTPKDWWYSFYTPFAILPDEGGIRILTNYDNLHFPSELVCVRYGSDRIAEFEQITHENEFILSQIDDFACEEVWLETVDHKQMQCWILYPPFFDETKEYPAIEIVLGGPQGTNGQDWSYRWCYRLMASNDYIVILPNRRGTTAFGQEWKEQISGDYGGLNMQDYLTAGRYIKSKPYVSKLACCGASYGGYSAYMLEGLHGDLFDCFIAHAGIFDEKQLWFTTEEMWFANWDNGGLTPYKYTQGQTGPAGDGITFGGMQQAGAPYASTPKAQKHYAGAPSSMVTKWHTPILCIHGGMDFRIPYEQGMAAFNAAQMMGVPSKLVIFPEENHWILKPQNALFWHRTYFDWLDKWTKQ